MKHNFETSLNKIKIMFKYSGMNLERNFNSIFESLTHRWVFWLNYAWTLVAVIFIFVGISNGQNFIEMTCIVPCIAMTVLAIAKSVFHCINEHQVKKLIANLKELENNDLDRPESIERNQIIEEEKDFLDMVISVLYFLNCSMILVFDLTPIIIMAVKYYKTNEFAKLLPYLDVFVFIPYKFEYWVLVYILQIWAECIVLLFIGAADYLFFTCCTYLRIHFRLLQHDLEQLTSAGVNGEVNFRKNFTDLVRRHQELIEYVDNTEYFFDDIDSKSLLEFVACLVKATSAVKKNIYLSAGILEKIYSKSTLSNFALSSLVICLSGFNVTAVKDITVIVTYLIFLSMSLMQVYFLCFFGDILMRASEEVSNAVYNCRWYTEKASMVKDLLFTITRAQKPCKLTAAQFADVNLRAFMRVLSSSWSYFALLQTVYNR